MGADRFAIWTSNAFNAAARKAAPSRAGVAVEWAETSTNPVVRLAAQATAKIPDIFFTVFTP
jgi:hypothetical protein